MDEKTAFERLEHEQRLYETYFHDPGPLPGRETLGAELRYLIIAEIIRGFLVEDTKTPELEIIPRNGDYPAIKLQLGITPDEEDKDIPYEVQAIWSYDDPQKLNDLRTKHGDLQAKPTHERFSSRFLSSDYMTQARLGFHLNNLEHSVDAYERAANALIANSQSNI